VKVGFITHLQRNPAERFGGSASEKALPHWQLQLIRSPGPAAWLCSLSVLSMSRQIVNSSQNNSGALRRRH
jgi:hypothetical protein